MSWSSSSAEGRAAAQVTNTAFRLRTIVEFRIVTRYRLADGTIITVNAPADGTIQPDRTYIRSYGELIGECGHTVKVVPTSSHYKNFVTDGKRMRCPSCPIEKKARNA